MQEAADLLSKLIALFSGLNFSFCNCMIREECSLRVLRRIFGPKREELTGEWRKLHNEKLNYLYC
jgi:hypothetical protein